jgi:ribosomal protein S18 acetylase RimI-like enzyme
MTRRQSDAEPVLYRIRPATLEDIGFLADVVVEEDNPRARRLYERLGCVQVAEDEQEHKLRWSPQAPR